MVFENHLTVSMRAIEGDILVLIVLYFNSNYGKMRAFPTHRHKLAKQGSWHPMVDTIQHGNRQFHKFNGKKKKKAKKNRKQQ